MIKTCAEILAVIGKNIEDIQDPKVSASDRQIGWRDERFNLPDDMDFCSYGER